MIRETEGYILTIDEFQAHSHAVDTHVLNYTGNYSTDGEGMTGSLNTSFSANSDGFNAIDETTINIPTGEANHAQDFRDQQRITKTLFIIIVHSIFLPTTCNHTLMLT